MVDGARDALAGYLYQILGAAGLSSRACGGVDDRDNLTCDLVLLARQSRILHEVHGEDLVLEQPGPGNESTAVQFKFSRSAGNHPVQPTEIREILHAFHRSRQVAAPALNLTGFVLVTNRPLSGTTQRLYDRRTQATPFAMLKEPERNWLMTRTKKAKEIQAAYGSIQAAAAEWHSIFQKLRIFPGVVTDHWLDGLRRYTLKRGLPPEEFEATLSRLVGETVRATLGQQLNVSREWLNQTLLSFPDARSLDLAEQHEPARAVAEQRAALWLTDNLVPEHRSLIRRSLLDAVGNEVAQHPIVLLLGDGGCGKSVLAGRFLAEAAPKRFVAAVAARDFHRHWVAEAFNTWRSPGQHDVLPVLQSKEVVRRLRLANEGGEKPILLIDIDGLDEANPPERQELRRLLDLARTQEQTNPTALVVILTARLTEPDIDRVRRRIIRDLTSTEHPDQLTPLFGVVQVLDFTTEELARAARQVEEPVRRRLEESLRSLPGGQWPATDVGDETAPVPERPVASRELLESLRHPALWGEFLDLPPGVKDAVLDAGPDALHQLAGRFLDRFCHKTLLRRPTLPEDSVRFALARIARRVPAGEGRSRKILHWVTPASAPGPLRPQEATDLFREAMSYGMIQYMDEPDWWSWRHRFICDYLCGQEEGP